MPDDTLTLLGLAPKVSPMGRGGMFPVDNDPLSDMVQGLPQSTNTETAIPFNLIFPLSSLENQKVFI
jgi:hypothetical protein